MADVTPARVSTTNAAGATLRQGDTGWVLLDERPERGLGAALAWARQQQVADLHVIADAQGGVLARRAAELDPAPQVWTVDGRTLVPAAPAPFEPVAVPSPDAERAAELLRAPGVDVVVEHGTITGEVEGLEVARVVVDERGARVEVGVGRHDREAFAMLHGEVPTPAALASVVETVLAVRHAGAAPHPLNRLAAERWLRRRVIAEPSIVGAVELTAVEGTLPRDGVKDVMAAAAVGTDVDGRPDRGGRVGGHRPGPGARPRPTCGPAPHPGPGSCSCCPNATPTPPPGRWPRRSPSRPRS